MIDNFLSSELKVGDVVVVKHSFKPNAVHNAEILKIDNDILTIKRTESGYRNIEEISRSSVLTRATYNIGINPFNEKNDCIRPISYPLESIIYSCHLYDDENTDGTVMNNIPIMEINWNPYVYNNKGKKEYYQRGFVWKLKDSQLLIQSIYEGIDCGKILIRLHGWDELMNLSKNGEIELSFKDIVDGKQRLHAIRLFIHDQFKDLNDNYFSDLSDKSQNLFIRHQLFSYAEMPENTKDYDVIEQFLKLNFSGVPQSKEHIDFVREISKRI